MDGKVTVGNLEASDEGLSGFFANTYSMLCIASFDGYFKHINRAWEVNLGWTIEELLARPFIEFVHPDDRAATLSEMEVLIQGGRTIQFENRYVCKDESYKWLQWDANSLRDRELVYAIARDVSSERGLEMQVLQSTDREKERLGRELHDGLCQNLAGITALSTAVSRKMAVEDPLAKEVADIARLLTKTIGNARDMARGLNPVNLEGMGLIAALEILVANVEALFRVSCRFKFDPDFHKLSLEKETHIYRIAQEAINNAITHGRSDEIDILLSTEGDRGLISISDNGIGMSEAQLLENSSELNTMRYRARFISGVLKLHSNSPTGIKVVCSFHLSETSHD